MKTSCAATLFTVAVIAFAAPSSFAHPTSPVFRHLQNMPPTNPQGSMRPGPAGTPFGGFPTQGTGPGPFPPMGPQMLGQQNVGNGLTQNVGAGTTQNVGVGEADATAAGSAVDANAAPTTAVDPSVASTTDIAANQPTIMVILPDSIAAHSGWSSYSGDVGENKTPSTEKPAETTKPTATSAAPTCGSPVTFVTTFVAIATALGLINEM